MHRVIEAQNVTTGDKVFDKGYFADDKWVRVKKVTTKNNYTMIDVGYCQIGKHAREGVAVE